MHTLNVYQTKPNEQDFTQKARHRLAEIEIFLMFEKLRAFASNNLSKEYALKTLFDLLNPDNHASIFEMELLRTKLMQDPDFPPHIDEFIVYLRYKGLGLNKVTKISKKQHYYLKTRFSNYSITDLENRVALKYDWNWSIEPYTSILQRATFLAEHLFQMHTESFYSSLDYRFKKNRFYLSRGYTPKDRV